MQVTQGKPKHTKRDSIRKKRKSPFEMNIIGDTYFGEYYTRKRQAKDIDDALTSKGRYYSFDGIRDFLKQEILTYVILRQLFLMMIMLI